MIGLLVLAIVMLAVSLWLDPSDDAGVTVAAEPAVAPRRDMTLPAPPASQQPLKGQLDVPDVPRPTTDVEASEQFAPLLFTVRHDDGRPGSGLRVALVDRGEIRACGDTDALGRLELKPALEAPAPESPTIWIGGATDRVLLRPTDSSTDAGQLALPPGLAISGVVTVDGSVPAKPVELSLRGFGRRGVDLTTFRALARAGSDTHIRYAPNAQRTTHSGRFLFSGLPDGWTGRLFFSDEYLLDGRHFTDVAAPWEDLALELTRSPVIIGQAVYEDGRPVPGARVSCATVRSGFHGAPDNRAAQGATVADADGRFQLPCGWSPGAQTLVFLEDPPGRHSATIVRQGLSRAQGADLGRVVLELDRRAAFRVVDPSGQPVSGAIAVANDDRARISAPTDDEGLGELKLSAAVEQMTVHALRHESSDVSISAQGDLPFDVVVEPCAVLEVAVDVVDGGQRDALFARLSSATELFTRGVSFGPEPMRHDVGVPAPSRSQTLTDGSVTPPRLSGSVQFPVGGPSLVISCLRPWTSFDLSIVDVHETILWSRNDLSLAAGEWRLVSAQVRAEVQAARGFVRDEQGRPIEGANVYLGVDLARGGIPEQGVLTDAAGAFGFDGIRGNRLTLEIEKVGFQAQRMDDLLAPWTSIEVKMHPQPSQPPKSH